MNRVFFAGVLSVAIIASLSATADPKLNRVPGSPTSVAPETPTLDFGDPVIPLGEPEGTFDDWGDIEGLEAELPAAPLGNAASNTSPNDFAGLGDLATLILKALDKNDPDQLKALSDDLQGKVPAITNGSLELQPSEVAEVMQLYATLAAGGYELDLTQPLFLQPIPPIVAEPFILPPPPLLVEPLIVPPPVIDLPDPGFDEPAPFDGPLAPALPDVDYADGYFREGVAFVPHVRVGRADTFDQQFDRFFSLTFDAAAPVRLLRLEVDRSGHLAMRAFHNPDVINWVGYTLRSDAGGQWTPGRDDLIWVQPGGYDLIVRLSDRTITGGISLRIEINEPLDRTEPNDSKEQAIAIDLPFRKRVFLEAENDVDWFSFTIGEEGVLSAAATDAGLEIYAADGEPLPLPDTSEGTRYLIVQPGPYYARVHSVSNVRFGKITLRHYPPSSIAAEINRIIGVGLESDPETAGQMRAVSYATGTPLVETTDVAEIAAALEEASGASKGAPWWLWAGLLVGILIAAGAYFLSRKK